MIFVCYSTGPDSGILMTNVLSHVFKGKVFPASYRNEYIELLSKFEVALTLDKYRLLVPSMLASKPKYTIHTFTNVFPRPSMQQVLRKFADSSSLFGSPTRSMPAINADIEVTNELIRTGLLLRRFYFMSFVPNGFWPRLISRFLTDNMFYVTVLRSFGMPEAKINDLMKDHERDSSAPICNLTWSYWKTGIEFWYKEISILRVADVTPDVSYTGCLPSPSIFEQTDTSPIEPSADTDGLTFELNSQWLPIDLQPHRGIEILVADAVCPQIIQTAFNLAANTEENGSQRHREPSWMSAKLLARIVTTLDTLLEDWYPGIGNREGKGGGHSIPYVNRIVPCPFCVNGAVSLKEYCSIMDTHSPFSASLPAVEVTKPLVIAPVTSDKEFDSSSSSRQLPFNRLSSKGNSSRAKRALFGTSQMPFTEQNEDACQYHSEPISSPPLDDDSESEEDPLPDNSGGLMMVSKFGFMLEVCILASRQEDKCVVCPLHKDSPLVISDVAPDLVSTFCSLYYWLLCVCLCMCVRTRLCVFVHSIYMYNTMYVHVYTYVHMYICMYVRMYVYVCA